MKKKNLKKLIILNIPYFVIGLVATNIGEAFRIAGGTNASEKVQSVILDGCFGTAFSNPLPSLHSVDLLVVKQHFTAKHNVNLLLSLMTW